MSSSKQRLGVDSLQSLGGDGADSGDEESGVSAGASSLKPSPSSANKVPAGSSSAGAAKAALSARVKPVAGAVASSAAATPGGLHRAPPQPGGLLGSVKKIQPLQGGGAAEVASSAGLASASEGDPWWESPASADEIRVLKSYADLAVGKSLLSHSALKALVLPKTMDQSGQGLFDLAFYASPNEKRFCEGDALSPDQRKSLLTAWSPSLQFCVRVDEHGMVREWRGGPPFLAILPDKAEESQRAPWYTLGLAFYDEVVRSFSPDVDRVVEGLKVLGVPGEKIYRACELVKDALQIEVGVWDCLLLTQLAVAVVRLNTLVECFGRLARLQDTREWRLSQPDSLDLEWARWWHHVTRATRPASSGTPNPAIGKTSAPSPFFAATDGLQLALANMEEEDVSPEGVAWRNAGLRSRGRVELR